MLEIIEKFLDSQLFGVIIGAILAGSFTLLVDKLRFSKEEKIYLKRKRESLYQKMYGFIMKYEKDICITRSSWMSEETKDLWNEIQTESIFGRQKTMDYFYDLFYDLQKNLANDPGNIAKVHSINNERILEFYVFIKKELGIKD